MGRTWTYGQKIAGGFAAVVLLALVIGGVAVYALTAVVDAKNRVIDVVARQLVDAQRLDTSAEAKTAAGRAYALAGAQRFLDALEVARRDFDTTADRLRDRLRDRDALRLLEAVRDAGRAHDEATDRMIAARREGATVDVLLGIFDDDMTPRRDAMHVALEAFVVDQERRLAADARAATERADTANLIVVVVAVVALLLAIAIALLLTRALTAQIGSAVQHVQSSSSELQAAANQQATGAKEQATAMAEITTTISELLATSKQIAESAQRVAQIAEETATSARTGERTVQASTSAMATIKRQVDVIVAHMLELGKKSQQIGGVLELINELAEQTNILAINATIEAAGAGDAGKRFAVVADEIRKLADRVGGSTKEIRGLIDEIRTAVNTTVMATEGGSKAVDAGAQQVADAAASLGHISGLVGTTTEAAREIELSTKQQATAVEQVNVAVANVAQATRENEASSNQTLQTASQLSGLSRDLLRLIQPQASA